MMMLLLLLMMMMMMMLVSHVEVLSSIVRSVVSIDMLSAVCDATRVLMSYL